MLLVNLNHSIGQPADHELHTPRPDQLLQPDLVTINSWLLGGRNTLQNITENSVVKDSNKVKQVKSSPVPHNTFCAFYPQVRKYDIRQAVRKLADSLKSTNTECSYYYSAPY